MKRALAHCQTRLRTPLRNFCRVMSTESKYISSTACLNERCEVKGLGRSFFSIPGRASLLRMVIVCGFIGTPESCPSSAINLEARKIIEESSRANEAKHLPRPSVSSLFPYGPGSTDPSEWPLRSFYKRVLPKECVRFGSEQGIKLFQESLASGNAAAYFPLAEQFRTQDEPAFCGLSTLTMVLNSLAIDPGRIWKGGWRWFSEELLDCCESLEKIRKSGIAFDKLSCLASCNGANVETWRAVGKETDAEEFRSAVKAAAATTSHFMIASYSRSHLGQTGDGHFSPIAAYHEPTDMVLIMDTARFKYPPHWIPLPLLVEAMQKLDQGTGKARGYMKLSRASGDGSPSSSILFVLTLRKGFDDSALRVIRRFFASVRAEKQRNEEKTPTPPPRGSEEKSTEDSSEMGIPDVTLPECETCSKQGRELSAYVSCFFSTVPPELLAAVSTVVHEFRVDFGDIPVRQKYQDTVKELLTDIRALPIFPHVAIAVRNQRHRLKDILRAAHGVELLTVLLLAAPVQDLSACGTRVDSLMRLSEESASELVRNEIKALRNQLWTVFRPRGTNNRINAEN